MSAPRRRLYTYGAVVALYVLVFAWWMFYFAHQSEFLATRLQRGGVELTPVQMEALRAATDESMRMFLFEGGFLGLMLLAGVFLVVRSLQREIAAHRQQRNFLSAVTHEFKSPITSARLYVDSLLLGRAEGEKRERYLRHARQDLDRLLAMVDQLLESARAAERGALVSLERLDLSRCVQDALAELGKEPEYAATRLDVHANGPVPVQADPRAVRTILRNLLSNAVKYGPPEGPVEVRVGSREGRGELAVRDFGPGLQGADAKAIFEPFVRGGDEHVRTRPGVGLGLFLVRELAAAHAARVRAGAPADGAGLEVRLSLPLEIAEPREASGA